MSARMGRGDGALATTPAPIGRGEFVEKLVNDFENRRMGVEPEVVGYILKDVLVPEEQWRAGIEMRRFDLGVVRGLMEESLDAAADIAMTRERIVIDRELAEQTFYDTIHGRCAVPFLIC